MTTKGEFRAYMKAVSRTSDNSDDRHLSEAQVISYCRGEMSKLEYEASQTHLERCEQCMALFRDARNFLEPADPDEERVSTAETNEAWLALAERLKLNAATQPSVEARIVAGGFQRRRAGNFFADSRITLGMAAGLLISFALLGWFVVRYRQERQSRQQSQELASQLENKQRELEQRLSILERSSDDQLKREREQRLAAEAERDQLQALLGSAHQDQPNIPVYQFRLSSERGAEEDLRLNLASGVQLVRLRLFKNKPYEFPEYAIELIDQRGKVVREISRLRPASNDGALSVLLNSANLTTGNYKLRLFGGQSKQQLGDYALAVTVRR